MGVLAGAEFWAWAGAGRPTGYEARSSNKERWCRVSGCAVRGDVETVVPLFAQSSTSFILLLSLLLLLPPSQTFSPSSSFLRPCGAQKAPMVEEDVCAAPPPGLLTMVRAALFCCRRIVSRHLIICRHPPAALVSAAQRDSVWRSSIPCILAPMASSNVAAIVSTAIARCTIHQTGKPAKWAGCYFAEDSRPESCPIHTWWCVRRCCCCVPSSASVVALSDA